MYKELVRMEKWDVVEEKLVLEHAEGTLGEVLLNLVEKGQVPLETNGNSCLGKPVMISGEECWGYLVPINDLAE